jgi:hypothetical protein
MIKPMLLGGAYLTKYRRLMATERNFVLWAPSSSIWSECVMNSLHIFLEHCPFFMTYKKEMFSRSQKRFNESNWDVTSLSEFDMNYSSHSEHYIANFHDFWKGNNQGPKYVSLETRIWLDTSEQLNFNQGPRNISWLMRLNLWHDTHPPPRAADTVRSLVSWHHHHSHHHHDDDEAICPPPPFHLYTLVESSCLCSAGFPGCL